MQVFHAHALVHSPAQRISIYHVFHPHMRYHRRHQILSKCDLGNCTSKTGYECSISVGINHSSSSKWRTVQEGTL